MRIEKVSISGFRSILNENFELDDYSLLVGANNSGKSSTLAAIRVFLGDQKWSDSDTPKIPSSAPSTVEVCFRLDCHNQALFEPEQVDAGCVRIKRQLDSRVGYEVYNKSSGDWEELSKGAVRALPKVVFIPAQSVAVEHLKTTGPSLMRDLLRGCLGNLSSSQAYLGLGRAIRDLEQELSASGSPLQSLKRPLTKALENWGIDLKLETSPLQPDDIVKNLISAVFVDQQHGEALTAESFGHGFQRSVVYELIKLQSEIGISGSGAGAPPTESRLILFEEPEAFLHPTQQENLATSLRALAETPGEQVIVTTHSPWFVSRSTNKLASVIRLWRKDGVSKVAQITSQKMTSLLDANNALKGQLTQYLAKPGLSAQLKSKANNILSNHVSNPLVAAQEEAFRYQIWLNPDRAGMVFANRVVLVEGPTEKVLFDYLLSNEWRDLQPHCVQVVDGMGKYGFCRFMALFEALAIPHGVLLDGDGNKDEHAVLNACIAQAAYNNGCQIHVFQDDLETELGLQVPMRPDKKPVEILKAVTGGVIGSQHLQALRVMFERLIGL